MDSLGHRNLVCVSVGGGGGEWCYKSKIGWCWNTLAQLSDVWMPDIHLTTKETMIGTNPADEIVFTFWVGLQSSTPIPQPLCLVQMEGGGSSHGRHLWSKSELLEQRHLSLCSHFLEDMWSSQLPYRALHFERIDDSFPLKCCHMSIPHWLGSAWNPRGRYIPPLIWILKCSWIKME